MVAGTPDVGRERVISHAQHPRDRLLGGGRDWPVPVLQGRMRLAPGCGGLLDLQRGLTRYPQCPACAEKDVMRPVQQLLIQLSSERHPRLPDSWLEIMADVRPEQGQRARGEAGLDNRLLVRIVKHHQLINSLADRRGTVGGDRDLADRAGHGSQRAEHLACRARPRDGQD